MRGEALQMPDRGRHALTAEAVEGPYKQEVELASCCAGEHRCELLSVLGTLATILVLDVLAHDWVAHPLAPCTQLQQLVVGGLPLIVRRNPGINGNRANTICGYSCNPAFSPFSHQTFLLCLSCAIATA